MSGWIIRYPRRKGEPPLAVGPFLTRDVAAGWHEKSHEDRRPEFLELLSPGPAEMPLPKIPTHVWVRRGGLPRFTRAHELRSLSDSDAGWFIVGEENALRPNEPALVERFENHDNVWVHIERVVARRTVTHRDGVEDVYGTTVRYVLATFTNRYPESQRSRP